MNRFLKASSARVFAGLGRFMVQVKDIAGQGVCRAIKSARHRRANGRGPFADQLKAVV